MNKCFILILGFILSVLLISGCVNFDSKKSLDQSPSDCVEGINSWCEVQQRCVQSDQRCVEVAETKDDAVRIAKDFIVNMSEFKKMGGKNLIVTNMSIPKTGWPNKWDLNLEFEFFDEQAQQNSIGHIFVDYSSSLLRVVKFVDKNSMQLTSQQCNNLHNSRIINASKNEFCDTWENYNGGLSDGLPLNLCCISTKLTLEEATQIAQNSECTVEANLITKDASYNEFTNTWWFGLDLVKPGCGVACVVKDSTKTAYIQWMCTGAN